MKSAILATCSVCLALGAAACGKPVGTIYGVKSSELSAEVKDNSFSLGLSPDVVAAYETALVELNGPQKYSQSFVLSREKVVFPNVAPGDYMITLQLLSGESVKQEAKSQVHVEVGKVARATIVLKPASAETGRVVVQVQEKAEGSIAMLPVFSDEIAEITIRSDMPIPRCNGLKVNYLRNEGKVSLEECVANDMNAPRVARTFQLNSPQKQALEKVLSRLGIVKTSSATHCVPLVVGAEQVSVTTKDKAGKEKSFEVRAPICGEEDLWVLEKSRIADAVTEIQALALMLKGFDFRK
jgi:hypothetical protein